MAEGQSPRWTAPEVLAETETPSTEADVFSFGMVMVEVCSNSMTTRPPKLMFWYKAFTGTVPFSNHISSAAMMAIMRGERPPRPTHLSLTDRLGELMNHCLNQDRHDRPRMLEVLLGLNPLANEFPHPSGLPPVTADVPSPISDIRQRLENLEPSDEEYRPLLYALLSHRDLNPYICGLQNGDLQRFVEFLDEVGKADIYFTSTDITWIGAQPHPGHGRFLQKGFTQTAEHMRQPRDPSAVLHHFWGSTSGSKDTIYGGWFHRRLRDGA